MKPSGIGGQAVIEGVMMKNKDQYAIAVRKPNNEIIVEKSSYISKSEKYKILKLPIFRGILAFVESMIIGTKTLTFSASFYEEEEEVKPSKMEKAFANIFKEKAESIAMGITMMISVLLMVGIFIILPRFIANLLTKQIDSYIVLTIIEGCIRILIFIAYVVAISQLKDIKRMFMYHGAEHKTINCLEQGFDLTVENVRWQSKQHKRCGTSFMFLVMFISIIFFIFIRVDQEWLRYLLRIVLIPVIAGVSYEFIRLAGKSESIVVNILSQPGMWMQALTTKEPDDSMIEVAIQSVDSVFDWRQFLESEKTDGKNKKGKNNTTQSKNSKSTSSKGKNNKSVNTNSTNSKGNNSNNDNNKSNNLNAQNNKNNNSNKSNKSNDKSNNIKSNYNNSNSGGKGKNSKNPVNSRVQNLKENSDEDLLEIDVNKDDIAGTAYEETPSISSMKRSNRKSVNESAATTEKNTEILKNAVIDDEEDDEILRALDRYLVSKEESIDKE